MVYTTISGTTTTKTNSRRLGIAPIFSPEAFLFTWLICGLVPITLAAGIGSKDATDNGSFVFDGQLQQNNSSRSSLINNVTKTSERGRATSPINYYLYDCPTTCQCEYNRPSQKLDIQCQRSENAPLSSSNNKMDLSAGVRTLCIRDTLLVDGKSVKNTLPPLQENTLVQLDLEHVTIEPRSLFANSQLFRQSETSLRRLTIKGSKMRTSGDIQITDLPTVSIRALLQPLASLKGLDSLNVEDSSPSLATVVLHAMPAVRHLRAVNNSLYDIPYECLTSNPDQYSVIVSIDFSKNHLSLIPNGLLQGLKMLRTLDVSRNRIFHLQEQVFTGLSALRKLNISHNQIEYVDAEVFTPLQDIQTVDLSHNEVVQFFGPYFGNNKRLEVLNLSNMWVGGTFASSETATRSLMETEQLIHTLHRVEKLDISDNGMRSLPETLGHAPNLKQVDMDGNQWECSCEDRWFLDWVETTNVAIGSKNLPTDLWCFSRPDASNTGKMQKQPFYEYLRNLTMFCSNSNIVARTPYKYHAVMGKNKQLYCHAQKPNWPKITWITPSKQRVTDNGITEGEEPHPPRPNRNPIEPSVSADGTLFLTNVTGGDYGLYLCVASYKNLNITHYVHLGMDVSIFRDVRLMSILIGWTFSFSFLLIVLFYQLVKIILSRLGVQCVTASTTKKSRRVRAFFDSIEQNKTSQLDWLRDNYNMQAKKIKDNCYSQLERIRESYSTQSKNLGEIREYGTQQLNTLRDQYNDQVRRVASYSAHRLCKVRENYVFKRNQVCKFSNHQLLRLRETYKWQAQTLNKILENLPRGLNFDTCRGMGACGRTDSIYLDDFGEEFGPLHADVQSELFHMTSGHQHQNMLGFKSTGDKLEHVSLLIPPEFVSEYKQSSGDIGTQRRDVIKEGADLEVAGTSASAMQASCSSRAMVQPVVGVLHRLSNYDDKLAIAEEMELDEDNSTTSTQPTTATIESSTPSTGSGSYSASSLKQTTEIETIDTTNITTDSVDVKIDRHDENV